jgi:peptide/nickel transport system ATP-binding protein
MSDVLSITKAEPLLRVEELTKYYVVKGRSGFRSRFYVRALEDVSITVRRGETLGVVGESGSGKTTLLRVISLILRPDKGRIILGDRVLFSDGRILEKPKGKIQMVFQDPDSSFNPTMRVKQIVAEPLAPLNLSKAELQERVVSSLESVGLGSEFLEKYPSQLSGGQKQRVSIARALVSNPELILLDEPTSSLDAVVQAQILNLLIRLQRSLNLTYIFVTHNLSVARYISDRLTVFYAGRICEMGAVTDVLSKPLHPYTLTLKQAFPTPNPESRTLLKAEIEGEPVSLVSPPAGCRFSPRCPYARDVCQKVEPILREVDHDRLSACHFAEEMLTHSPE